MVIVSYRLNQELLVVLSISDNKNSKATDGSDKYRVPRTTFANQGVADVELFRVKT
jgi:hypothetical protein